MIVNLSILYQKIKLFQKLKESPLKDEFIEQLNEIITKDEKSRKEISHISMKEIMNGFNSTNKTITIKDLQKEIKILKQEIQELLELEGKELINKQRGKEKIVYEEEEENKESHFINILSLITTHKWNIEITLILGRYSYYDYIEAWTQILLINPEKHYWFIWFKKGIPLRFPRWFMKWYYHYGAISAIFPQKFWKFMKFLGTISICKWI
ncbi:hypothetical protein CR513_21831, partial [Mucuna pruriens]